MVMATGVVAAACTGDGDTSPETTVAATTTTQPPREDDGSLTIGLLLPSSDALLGQGLEEAAREAIARVNEAGGALGRPVRFFSEDEGDTSATAAVAIEELLANDVDAIVGPASSLVALDRMWQILEQGVVSCSPTASALTLDEYPDDDGLFFRTIPSDSLQALAIARVVQDTGARSADIAFVDDAFGLPLSAAVERSLLALGIEVPLTVPFRSGDTDLSDEVGQLVGSDARVTVLLADGDDGATFLEELGRSDGFLGISSIVVNDAIRDPTSAQRIEALPTSLRIRLTGVAPQASATDAREEDPFAFGPFAFYAFDCVNLIALGAVQGNSDSPRVIASQMPTVSSGGRPCRSFEACAELLGEGLEINYNGPSGITELLQRGDPRRARFELFSFAEDGRDQFESVIVVEV